MKNKILFALLFFFSLIKNIDAQQYISFFPSPINDQLFQNTVTGLNKDKYGFLWITSQFGIYCYDGHNLKHFNTANTKELISNRFSGIFKMKNNNQLFALGEFNQVYLLENKKIKIHYPSKNTNFLFYKTVIIADSLKQFKAHIQKLDNMYSAESMLKNHILYSYNNLIIKDFNHKIQVITKAKDIKLSYKFKYQILSIGSKYLTVQIDNKLYCIDLYKTEIRFHVLLSRLFETDLTTAYFDEISNIIYCGTFNNGLIQFSPNSIERFSLGTDPEDFTYLYSYTFDSITQSIFSILDNGVYQWKDKNPDNPIRITKGKWSGSACAILKNRELFYCINEKLNCYSIEDKKIKFQITCKPEIADIFEFNSKYYFISGNSIYEFNNEKIWIVKSFASKNYIYKVKIYNNNIHLCCSDGIIVLDGKLNKIGHYLKQKTVRDVQRYNSSLIAATYGTGVYIINNQHEFRIPNDPKNWMLAALGLRKDTSNRVWIVCNKGIFIIPENNFKKFTFDSSNYISLNIHSDLPASELNGGIYPENQQIVNNKILIPSDHGLLKINQIHTNLNKINLNVYLENILVNNNQKLGKQNNIILPRDHTALEIFIQTQYFQIGKPLPIFFKLKNIDANWQRVSNSRSIKFSRLPPGSYSLYIFQNNRELKILEITVNQIWYATWWFILLLILALGLAIVFVFIRNQRKSKEEKEILDLIVNHKTMELQFTVAELLRAQKILQEENNFKNQLYAILMHDIKSPLMFLAESSYLIYNKHKENENDLTNFVRIAANTSKELHDFISDFLNWLGTQFTDYKVEINQINVKNIIAELVKFYQPIANAKNIVIQTNHAENDTFINSNVTILQTILRNFIDNAIKYTPSGEINISIIEDSKHVNIIIADSGNGLPSDIVKIIKDWENQKLAEAMIGHSTTHKMGIKITLEFIKLIEGEITYVEKKSGGSIIQISLKKDITLK